MANEQFCSLDIPDVLYYAGDSTRSSMPFT